MPERPNILLFVPHDTGRFVSPYGYGTVHTPHCEQLAAEGVRCANSFATCPLCSPSRASMVTGRYPHQNGVMGLTRWGTGGWDLYPTERHAAALFGDAGYESVLCGPLHETQDCHRVGFEQTLCGRGGHNGGGDLREYGAALDSWFSARDSSRPFYLQLGSHETHREWTANDVEPDTSNGLWKPPYLADIPEVRQDMAEMQGASRRLDEGLGGVLAALDRSGQAENTIVVFTTDHGIDLPRAKGTFYDQGIETFLFLRYPAWGSGRVLEPLISNVDLLPTLLEACGLGVLGNVAGRSFLPLLTDGDYTPNEAVFAEKTYHDSYDPTRALRTDRYKYIRYFEANIFQDLRLATMTNRHYWPGGTRSWLRQGVEELYDVQADPWEQHDLSQDAAHAEVLQELRVRLLRWMRETDDPLLNGPVPSPFYQQQLAEFLAGDG